MNYFPGPTSIKLDNKGRFSVPIRYREILIEESGSKLLITADIFERILLLYPFTYWQKEILPGLIDLPSGDPIVRKIKRRTIGYATETKIDATGRIHVPSPLLQYADITNELEMKSMGNSFELCAPGTDELAPLDANIVLPEVLSNLKL